MSTQVPAKPTTKRPMLWCENCDRAIFSVTLVFDTRLDIELGPTFEPNGMIYRQQAPTIPRPQLAWATQCKGCGHLVNARDQGFDLRYTPTGYAELVHERSFDVGRTPPE